MSTSPDYGFESSDFSSSKDSIIPLPQKPLAVVLDEIEEDVTSGFDTNSLKSSTGLAWSSDEEQKARVDFYKDDNEKE